MSEALEVVAGVASEPEAELIIARLAEAGIAGISQRSIGGPYWGVSGSQYVYVKASEAERARELLEEGEQISDEELARLSEQAGREASEH